MKNKTRAAALMGMWTFAACAELANDRDEGSQPSDGDSHVVQAPAWHQEPNLEGASFPLPAGDPRAVLQLPEDSFFVEGGDALPLLSPQDKDIVGGESRTVITNTTTAPAKTVVLLVATFSGDPAGSMRICTGTMVGSDAVLTAAHCTYDSATQQWAATMVAAPGAYPDPNNANAYVAPYGTSGGAKLYAHDNYRTGTGLNKTAGDVGMVRIKAKLGTSTGTRTPAAQSHALNEGLWYDGYQGDLTRYQMYGSAGLLTGWLDQSLNLLKTSADGYHGASGAGLAKSVDNSNVTGTFVGGSGLSPPTMYNAGIAFNSAMVTKINSWTTAIF